MFKLVPVMKQYLDIKKKYKDILLFYQIGDFYELFYDDAIKVSKLLNITLTKKIFVKQNSVPMAGIPVKSSENFILKLIKLGESVALCCQIDNFKNDNCVFDGKKLIHRKVVKIITPGTVSESSFLNSNLDNYIASVYSKDKDEMFGYSFLDVVSGRFYICEICGLDKLKHRLLSSNPKEIIYPENFIWINNISSVLCLKSLSVSKFNFYKSYKILLSHFNLKSLNCFGIDENNLGIVSAGVLLDYVKSTQFLSLCHVNSIKLLDNSNIVFMDYFTIKNLELIDSISGNKRNTLYNLLNKTRTPMGCRMLKRWIINPLNDFDELNNRHKIINFIKYYFNEMSLLFNEIGDIERILGRISLKNSNSKDLINFKNYLIIVLRLNNLFRNKCNLQIINYLSNNDKLINNIINLIHNSIIDSDFDDDNLILSGYNSSLDNLRKSYLKNKKNISDLERRERDQTGISNLFIKYSKIHGFYIQINKSDLNLVPKRYIKYQMLKNSVRYVLNELKIFEINFIHYKRKIIFLERKIFDDILNYIINFVNELKLISYYISKLDVLLGFCEISGLYNYKKPIFCNDSSLEIVNGRHPVLEVNLDINFIPNSLFFNKDNRCLVITGPNMGGKSTYMRQVALICIMAFIGCYVSADSLRIGFIDKILTRIGFSDDILSNKSTFMVEMREILNIITSSTSNSLILIDEMGRGTSFYEGVSLAWSCLYYIVNTIKSMILFSTHYIELTKMSDLFSCIKNVYCDYLEKDYDVILLYKIKRGVCYKSYGINMVYKIGFCKSIIDMSNSKFKDLVLNNLDKEFLIKNNFCFNIKHHSISDIMSNVNLKDSSKEFLFSLIKKIKDIF